MTSDYFSIDCLSASRLQLLHESPELFRDRYVLGIPEPQNDAFKIGSAVHCLVLEPSCFYDRYVTYPKVDLRTKTGKEELAKVQQTAQGKVVLNNDEESQVLKLAQAFQKHNRLVEWLETTDKVIEEPIQFELFGQAFKAKPDCVIPQQRRIIDIKTCKSADPHRWKWSALDYGYHRQAAIYIDACFKKYGEPFECVFACVSKSHPFEVSVIQLEDETIAYGREDTHRLVESYERRMKDNDWLPEHSKKVVFVQLPGVLVSKNEEKKDE